MKFDSKIVINVFWGALISALILYLVCQYKKIVEFESKHAVKYEFVTLREFEKGGGVLALRLNKVNGQITLCGYNTTANKMFCRPDAESQAVLDASELIKDEKLREKMLSKYAEDLKNEEKIK